MGDHRLADQRELLQARRKRVECTLNVKYISTSPANFISEADQEEVGGPDEVHFGRLRSDILRCPIFSWSHSPATYTSDVALFLVILIPLSLVYGYPAQRTDALRGSILVHAGGDISIALGVFSNL
jgi:hypothetical protein